jgi:hypothetical protein
MQMQMQMQPMVTAGDLDFALIAASGQGIEEPLRIGMGGDTVPLAAHDQGRLPDPAAVDECFTGPQAGDVGPLGTFVERDVVAKRSDN